MSFMSCVNSFCHEFGSNTEFTNAAKRLYDLRSNYTAHIGKGVQKWDHLKPEQRDLFFHQFRTDERIISELLTDYDFELYDHVPNDPDADVVFITRSNYYHRENCHYIQNADTQAVATYELYRYRFVKPCKACNVQSLQ